MEWKVYKEKFLEIARENGKNEKYCEKCLDYAKRLWEQQVPIIYDQQHLCGLLGYSAKYVYAISNSPIHFYRKFEIPKKSGGVREISEPLPNLKEIQKWILNNILQNMQVSPYAKAYIKGKNIKDNVKFHRKQKMILTLDIQNFFGKLSCDLVYKNFVKVGYNSSVSTMLTNLCCLQGALPQGAPTSALLSNILMKEFDDSIAEYAKINSIRYTRYADDMTFSGDFNSIELIRYVRQQLKLLGLKLNNEKTRIRKQGQQQEVTGIVVNYRPQVPKNVRRKIRQEMYYIEKYGLESHMNYIGETRQNYLGHLQGVIGYILFINPKDKEMRKYRNKIREYMVDKP